MEAWVLILSIYYPKELWQVYLLSVKFLLCPKIRSYVVWLVDSILNVTGD